MSIVVVLLESSWTSLWYCCWKCSASSFRSWGRVDLSFLEVLCLSLSSLFASSRIDSKILRFCSCKCSCGCCGVVVAVVLLVVVVVVVDVVVVAVVVLVAVVGVAVDSDVVVAAAGMWLLLFVSAAAVVDGVALVVAVGGGHMPSELEGIAEEGCAGAWDVWMRGVRDVCCCLFVPAFYFKLHTHTLLSL